PPQGTTLAPKSSQTYTFEVSLASNVPGASPLLLFEGYLDQINTASGSGATVADTLGTDITVPGSSSSSSGLSTGWYVLIGVGWFVDVAMVGFLLWRDHKRHQQTPTAGAAS